MSAAAGIEKHSPAVPGLFRRRGTQNIIGTVFVLAVAALVVAPLVSLALVALKGDT